MIDLTDSGLSRLECKQILSDLRRHEGLRLKPYTDSEGNLTIGYGHKLGALGISKEVAELILEDDLTKILKDLNRSLLWWRKLSKPQQRGLLRMAFNLGLPKLRKFKKMLAALRKGDAKLAAEEALDSKWAKQVGKRANRIANLLRMS